MLVIRIFSKAVICFVFIINVNLFAQSTPKRPNIILFLVDDLGWKDVGYMGSEYYETPTIDSLASQGMIFTNAYAAASLCSPTRASIMTGKYPARLGITDWIRARFQVTNQELKHQDAYDENDTQLLKTPTNPYWLDLEEVTLAELLQSQGYFTVHVGKWHLGPDKYYPENQGYDVNIAGSDMGQPVNYFDPYERNGIKFPNLKPRVTGEYLENRLSDELISVISSSSKQPFFISMNFYAVHTPLMAEKDLIEKYKFKQSYTEQNNPVYAAMISAVDNSIRNLLSALEEEVLANTMIIFFSDNGGMLPATNNKPLRAGKGYPYEGGIREPMFIYWKNRISPGSVSNLPISSVDFLPTICSVTHTPIPNTNIDGRDISPVLFGEDLTSVPLYWHYPHYRPAQGDMPLGHVLPYSIILDNGWKLIKRYEGKEFELFNLNNDIGETQDVSYKFPNKVNILNEKLEEWLSETQAKLPIEKAP